MNRRHRHQSRAILATMLLLGAGLSALGDGTSPTPAAASLSGRPTTPVYRSPQAIVFSPDGATAWVVNATANTVQALDVRARTIRCEIPVGERPRQAAFSPDGRFLYVCCAWGGSIDEIDVAAERVVRRLEAGLEPGGLAVSRDGRRLFVVNSVGDDLSILDRVTGRVTATVPVGNQPRYVVETPDGARVVVSNNLGRALTLIDVATASVVETRDLGRCSNLRGMTTSADGRWLFLANLVSHDEAPTLQIERGWIHSNGFTVADLNRPGHRVTMLLDQLTRGAANPSEVVLSPDGARLYVSLAGVHEIAFVDVAAVLDLVAATTTPDAVRRLQENVDLLEQRGIATRHDAGGLGPRSLALSVDATELWVANYFSDTVSVLDARTGDVRAVIPLGPPQEMSLWRQGEFLSCDARMCYQNWFSCVSCHQEDGTVDGLNWDLANDGLGNPKNAKDLINGHDTAPAMWGAVRADLNDGVAGGQRFEGFVADAVRQQALMTYFGNPELPPNPWRGRDPEAESRGRLLYAAAGCDICHPAPLYTDRKLHDLLMTTPDDYRSRFDTPSLRNVVRNGPWLHDGRARTLHALFTEHNPHDVHGRTKGLTPQELDDLVAYLRTL